MRTLVLCLMISVSTNSAFGFWEKKPSIPDLQTAYENASNQPGSTHIPGLKIVGSQCDLSSNGKFMCQIGFRIAGEPEDRVYLDVASVEPAGSGRWTLVSGLCRK